MEAASDLTRREVRAVEGLALGQPLCAVELPVQLVDVLVPDVVPAPLDPDLRDRKAVRETR